MLEIKRFWWMLTAKFKTHVNNLARNKSSNNYIYCPSC